MSTVHYPQVNFSTTGRPLLPPPGTDPRQFIMGNDAEGRYQHTFEEALFAGRALAPTSRKPVMQQVADATQSGQAGIVNVNNELRAGYTREAHGSLSSLRNCMVSMNEAFPQGFFAVDPNGLMARPGAFARLEAPPQPRINLAQCGARGVNQSDPLLAMLQQQVGEGHLQLRAL